MAPNDLIDAIAADHDEARRLFAKVETASSAEAKQHAFTDLARMLVAHETAEQEIVHPLTRRGPDGDRIVAARLEEEAKAEKALAGLERLSVGSDEWTADFASFRSDVLEHADDEEAKEHPRLREAAGADRLRQLAEVYETAKNAAPTHPHPHGPQSAVGNVVIGAFVAVADRVRDAAQEGLRKIS